MLGMRFQLGVFLLIAIGLVGCSTTEESQQAPPPSAVCSRYGDDQHFNSTRIKALQDLVAQQIQIAKSAPLSQKNSTLLPALEVLRRRVNYPFLQPNLTPHVVTRILQREVGNVISTLESEAPGTPNTVNTIQFLNQSYLPSLENREEWSCTSSADGQSGSTQSPDPSAEVRPAEVRPAEARPAEAPSPESTPESSSSGPDGNQTRP